MYRQSLLTTGEAISFQRNVLSHNTVYHHVCCLPAKLCYYVYSIVKKLILINIITKMYIYWRNELLLRIVYAHSDAMSVLNLQMIFFSSEFRALKKSYSRCCSFHLNYCTFHLKKSTFHNDIFYSKHYFPYIPGALNCSIPFFTTANDLPHNVYVSQLLVTVIRTSKLVASSPFSREHTFNLKLLLTISVKTWYSLFVCLLNLLTKPKV